MPRRDTFKVRKVNVKTEDALIFGSIFSRGGRIVGRNVGESYGAGLRGTGLQFTTSFKIRRPRK